MQNAVENLTELTLLMHLWCFAVLLTQGGYGYTSPIPLQAGTEFDSIWAWEVKHQDPVYAPELVPAMAIPHL